MLVELFCDKLNVCKNNQRISFHKGLNIVLGDEGGSNSIGKSTFLLMIDFALGGNTYTKAKDVQKYIGEHTVCFAFEFNFGRVYFSRNTNTNQDVAICDSLYNVNETISLKEYCARLKQYYSINQDELTFRDAVSRYSRICQKNNTEVSRPLSASPNEKQSDSLISLLKLFDKYGSLIALRKQREISENRLDVYSNAIHYGFIPSIKNKEEFTKVNAELNRLKKMKEDCFNMEELKNRNALELLKIGQINKRLQIERAEKMKLESALNRINAIKLKKDIDFTDDFLEIQQFFPKLDLKRIQDVECFHRELSTVLSNEIDEEKLSLNRRIQSVNDAISEDEKELASFDVPTGISTKILAEYSKIQMQIHRLEDQIEAYNYQKSLKDKLSDEDEQYNNRLSELLLNCSNTINDTIKIFNDIISCGQNNPPELVANNKSYYYSTPDDTGTGASHKALIIFDLSILHLTNLPFIMHDSHILSDISKDSIERIIEQYSLVSKQVFIAFDEASFYSTKIQENIEKNTVLRLSNNGHELFGISWNRQKNRGVADL